MAKEDKKEDEKLVMVGDGAEATETEEGSEGSAQPEKKETSAEPPEEATDDEEERVGHEEEEEGATDKEREAIRERRRQERKNRREKDQRLRKEVNFLRNRNEQLERAVSQVAVRQDQQEMVSIEQRIGTTEGQIRQAEEIHAAAVKNANGEVATEALRVKDSLNEELRKLKEVKDERETKAKKAPTEAPARLQPPAATIAWVKQNEWFDPSLRDETSHLVKVMEDRLAAEQEYDANSPEYWEELNRRIDARFPNLRKKSVKKADDKIFEDDDDGEEETRPAPKKKGGGPRFSVNGQQRPLKKNEVFINAERRKALEEAGVWDDQEARERYLKAYQKYDEEARNNK